MDSRFSYFSVHILFRYPGPRLRLQHLPRRPQAAAPVAQRHASHAHDLARLMRRDAPSGRSQHEAEGPAPD